MSPPIALDAPAPNGAALTPAHLTPSGLAPSGEDDMGGGGGHEAEGPRSGVMDDRVGLVFEDQHKAENSGDHFRNVTCRCAPPLSDLVCQSPPRIAH